MGDGNAPDEFTRDYDRNIRAYLQEDSQPIMQATCLLFPGVPIDMSICLFVDDLLRFHVFEDHSAVSTRTRLHRSNGVLNTCLAEGNYLQNESKLEVVSHF